MTPVMDRTLAACHDRLIGRLARCLGLMLLLSGPAGADPGNYLPRPEVQVFIQEMVAEEGFEAAELSRVFAAASYRQSIIDAMTRPAEKVLTWASYQDIFLTERRIKEGQAFMRTHADALQAAEKAHGVPAAIITAIIGVETMYGSNKGSYRVIDALATLGFDYPPRAAFFRSELKHFLLLAREEGLDPLQPVGSYAGAMGLGQFIASSYRAYAVDFDADGKRDIWDNPTDAIGSVANYLGRHGWQPQAPVTFSSLLTGDQPMEVYEAGMAPSITLGEALALGIQAPAARSLPASLRVAPLRLAGKDGPEYWLGFKNFYVITRYNHSPLYAMAVFQLSERLAAGPVATAL